MKLSYISEENAFLEFPIFAYPYYQCRDPVTGEEFVIEKGLTNNRIRIQVPANYEGVVEVAFVQPWYWRAAEIVSFAALIAVLWGAGRRKVGINLDNLMIREQNKRMNEHEGTF